jgi:hypothetical protein
MKKITHRLSLATVLAIAAFATSRALGNPACFSVPRTDAYAFEGYVYV